MLSQSQVFLLPTNLESERMTSHGSQDGFKMASSEGAFFETNFLRTAGTPEADTSVSEKAKCLLAIGEDQKSKPLGVTFSLKIYQYKVEITVGHLLLACHRCLRWRPPQL